MCFYVSPDLGLDDGATRMWSASLAPCGMYHMQGDRHSSRSSGGRVRLPLCTFVRFDDTRTDRVWRQVVLIFIFVNDTAQLLYCNCYSSSMMQETEEW